MATLKQTDSNKWIRGIVATGAIISAYVLLNILYKIGEFGEIEIKVSHYQMWAQIISVLSGIGLFVWAIRRADICQYLDEVFSELVKVVWPDRASTTKLTIGIVIAVFITSVVLGLVDLGVGKILGLLYKL